MKKNNYTFASGILLVIASSICILLAIVYMFVLFISIQYLSMNSHEMVDVDKTIYTIEALLYAGMVLFKVAQAVTFMLLGIKLIGKGKKGIPTQDCKGLVITSLVLSFICAFIEITSVSILETGLFLASGIVLACGLGKKQNESELVAVNTNVNNIQPATQPVANQDTSKVSPAREDNIDSQIKALQELRDKNVIGGEEYIKMLQKIVGIGVTAQETTTEEKTLETKKSPTARVKKLSAKPNSKENKE